MEIRRGQRTNAETFGISGRGADEIEVPDLDIGYFIARFVIVTMLLVPRILSMKKNVSSVGDYDAICSTEWI